MGFFRQQYSNGLLSPPPGDLPNPGIKPASHVYLHWQAGSLPLVPLGKPILYWWISMSCIVIISLTPSWLQAHPPWDMFSNKWVHFSTNISTCHDFKADLAHLSPCSTSLKHSRSEHLRTFIAMTSSWKSLTHDPGEDFGCSPGAPRVLHIFPFNIQPDSCSGLCLLWLLYFMVEL